MCQEADTPKKKEKLTKEERAERFYKRGQEFYEKTERECRHTREHHVASMKAFKEQLNQRLREHKTELEEMKRVFESCEETLLNVLLAIRQNEYLHAYYPPQNGFPELKVTGTHPANLDANKRLA